MLHFGATIICKTNHSNTEEKVLKALSRPVEAEKTPQAKTLLKYMQPDVLPDVEVTLHVQSSDTVDITVNGEPLVVNRKTKKSYIRGFLDDLTYVVNPQDKKKKKTLLRPIYKALLSKLKMIEREQAETSEEKKAA